jgi:hypothetical protein
MAPPFPRTGRAGGPTWTCSGRPLLDNGCTNLEASNLLGIALLVDYDGTRRHFSIQEVPVSRCWPPMAYSSSNSG